MAKQKMVAVAAMAMVLILLSANMETIAAQGVNCYDSCNTACVGLPERLYRRCDEKCKIRCGPDGKVDNGNLG